MEFSLVPHISKAVNQAKLEIWESIMGHFTELEKSIDTRFEEYVNAINFGPNEEIRQTYKKNFMQQNTSSHDQSGISSKPEQKVGAAPGKSTIQVANIKSSKGTKISK